MSDTEHNVGKLIPRESKGTIEETCRSILSEMGIDDVEDGEARERLDDEGYRKYFITDSVVYEAIYQEVDIDCDIFNATKNTDGIIDFEIKFYNGGCSFNEALEEALKKI